MEVIVIAINFNESTKIGLVVMILDSLYKILSSNFIVVNISYKINFGALIL